MYYRQVQPYQAHARIPAPDRYVYCYAFGLKPEELLHTGSVNMSRMDNANLRITYNPTGDLINPPVAGNLFIFARNSALALFILYIITNATSLPSSSSPTHREHHEGHCRVRYSLF